MACGADPRLFSDFVGEGYLPKARAAGCQRVYGEVAYAFYKLIVPHLDKDIAKAVLQKSWLPDETAKPKSH